MHEYDLDETISPDNGYESLPEEPSDDFREELFHFFKTNILSDDVQKRFEAVEVAGQLAYDQRLFDCFAELLKDPDSDRNLTGIYGLGAWKHSDGTEMLINYFTAQDNASKITDVVEEALLCALGAVGGDQALEFLIHYTSDHFRDPNNTDPLGMISVESITQIASHGHDPALRFLIDNCHHPSWNFRESCAAGLGALFRGNESIPRSVYDSLMALTKDQNANVRIAAYISLDEIIGLDEKNKALLNDARRKQVFGTTHNKS